MANNNQLVGANSAAGFAAGLGEDIADFFGFGSTRRERQWQESMSNTAYQRAVSDMKAAGLNPAMMYAGGSNMQASTGHSAASVGQLGQIAGVVSSAAQFISANNGKYAQKDNQKIANSAAGMIKTAQFLAKMLG